MSLISERVGNSLRVTLGPRVNWLGVLTALFVILILFGAGIVPAYDGLKIAIAKGASVGGYILGSFACFGLILFIAYNLLLDLVESEKITVTPTDLQIEWLVWGFVRSRREVPNSTVEKLRYERWPGPRGAGMQNGVLFDCVGETITFAQNLSENQSYDLIEQMRQIYPFAMPDLPDDEPSPAVTNW